MSVAWVVAWALLVAAVFAEAVAFLWLRNRAEAVRRERRRSLDMEADALEARAKADFATRAALELSTDLGRMAPGRALAKYRRKVEGLSVRVAPPR